MSNQFLHIPALLTAAELAAIDELLAATTFIDGKATASMAAKEVKNNLQVDVKDPGALPQVQAIIGNALASSPLFNAAILPKYIYPFLISKYTPGMYYGWHVDSPLMGNPPVRTDAAMTLFLSDPATYEGGELVIQSGQHQVPIKPAKGDAIVYPCQYLHCVNEVRSGERLAAVTWIQSAVRAPEQRQILYNLSQIHALLSQRDQHAPETNLLLQTHSNLMRMWTEV
jgi:PKHD-type hydroxylase